MDLANNANDLTPSKEDSKHSRRSSDLTIQDYLDASGDAASRVRNMVLAMIVASVLTFIALLNSLQNSWMLKRMQRLQNVDSQYLVQYIGPVPKQDDYTKRWHERYRQDYLTYQTQLSQSPRTQPPPNPDWYDAKAQEEFDRDYTIYGSRYQAFLSAGFRALVDTRFLVHVPFFGTTFDVNDLGSLSGIGLIALLVLFRLSISSELENIKLAFRQAKLQRQMAPFYRLLAMKQVLTTPHLPDREIGWFHEYVPGTLSFVPAFVYLLVTINDIYTNGVGFQIDKMRTLFLLGTDVLCFSLILALSIVSFQKYLDVDKKWLEAWCDYMAEEYSVHQEGEWLRRLYRAVEFKQFTPLQIVGSLPDPTRVNGKIVEYQSADRWLLTVDLTSNTVSIKPAADQNMKNEEKATGQHA